MAANARTAAIEGAAPAAAVEPSRAYLGYLLGLLLVNYSLNYADRQLLVILIEPIKQEFAVSDTVMGALTGLAFTVLFVTFSVPLARLADRWSRRNVLWICGMVWSGMTAASGLATQFWHLALARIGVGIGEAGGLAPSQSLVSAYFPASWRATALATLNSGGHIGSFIGLFAGAAIAQAAGWRTAFLLLGIPGVLLALLVLTTVREPPRPATPPGNQPGERLVDVLALCFKSRTFVLAGAAVGTATIASFGQLSWMPSFYVRVHGVSLVDASLLMGFASLSGGVMGAIGGARLADRLAARRPALMLSIPALGVLIGLPFQIAMLSWPESQFFHLGSMRVPVAALFAPIGTFFAAFWTGPVFAVAQSLVPAHARSQANALMLLIYMMIGQSLGPLVVGAISDLLHAGTDVQSIRYALLAVLFTVPVAAVLFFIASRLYPRELAARGQA